MELEWRSPTVFYLQAWQTYSSTIPTVSDTKTADPWQKKQDSYFGLFLVTIEVIKFFGGKKYALSYNQRTKLPKLAIKMVFHNVKFSNPITKGRYHVKIVQIGGLQGIAIMSNFLTVLNLPNSSSDRLTIRETILGRVWPDSQRVRVVSCHRLRATGCSWSRRGRGSCRWRWKTYVRPKHWQSRTFEDLTTDWTKTGSSWFFGLRPDLEIWDLTVKPLSVELWTLEIMTII